MQLPARRRWRAAGAAGAAAAAALVLVAVLAWARRHPQAFAEGADSDEVFVPDVPGAAEARQWLQAYYRERRQRGTAPRWPAAVALPSCEAATGPPAGPQQQRRHRHLVLTTVGDRWGPGADRNGCAQPRPLAACLATVLVHASRAGLPFTFPLQCAGGWTTLLPQTLTWWRFTLETMPAGRAPSACSPSKAPAPSERCKLPQCRRQPGVLPPATASWCGPEAGPYCRWQLLLNVTATPQWAAALAGRRPRDTFIWLPDDDLLASTCDINRLLRLMEQQRLLLAQVGRGGGSAHTVLLPAGRLASAAHEAWMTAAAPLQMSVCRDADISIAYEHLFQDPGTALRYTTL